MTLRPRRGEEPSLFIDSDPGMDQALSALRGSSLEPESPAASRLEIAVIRQWRLDRDFRSIRWWMPALGAAAAAVAVMLALLQFAPDPGGDGQAQPSSSSSWPSYTESGS